MIQGHLLARWRKFLPKSSSIIHYVGLLTVYHVIIVVKMTVALRLIR